MGVIEDRLAALEAGLRAAQDELAIIRLIASYGPLVDCGSTEMAPALFAADGIYDVSYGRMTGPHQFAALLESSEHQDALAGGIAHVMGLPWVRVDGDSAIATNATQIYLRDGDAFRTFRIAQNVWKLSRTAHGWQIKERMNRLIGSDDAARALLAAAI